MWFLAIIVTVLVHVAPGHRPRAYHIEVDLAYDSRYACEAAEARVNHNIILNATGELLKAQRPREWPLAVRTSCEPQTDGRESTGLYDFDSRMFRP